jgi:two-component system chemotaxis response regulator CheY
LEFPDVIQACIKEELTMPETRSSQAMSGHDRSVEIVQNLHPLAAAEKMSAEHAPYSVLIVDDDASLRDTLRRMVESVGYDVQCAEDARTAIVSFAKWIPDIIITDIYMPAGDGFELLNWLRNNGLRTPVIAMSGSVSGSGEYDQLSVAERLGAAAVIDKPFRQSKLVETIDRVLANRGAPPR